MHTRVFLIRYAEAWRQFVMYEGQPRNIYAQVQSIRLYIWSPTVLGIQLLNLSG